MNSRANAHGVASGGMLVATMVATILAVVAAIGLAVSAGAQVSQAPATLTDEFDAIRSQPSGPWYVINLGSEDGQAQRWEGVACGSDSCVKARKAGGVSYAELSVTPSKSPGFYVNAELAEQNTGYAVGQPGRWEPSPGHPVELKASVRWSSNHRADGGGGAQGSSGIWLWNSPVDANAPEYADFEAFGISWATGDSVATPGLNASVVRTTPFGPFPVWSAAPKSPPDLQQWNEVSMLWSENPSGTQTVKIDLNGRNLGTHTLSEPFGPLSVEIWSDNQVATPGGIEFRNPTAKQSFEVDRISVARR